MPGGMFIGRYARTIDEKGRTSIPAKVRAGLAAGVVITQGFDGCLFMFPASEWEQLAQRVSQLPLTDPIARTFTRFMFANASECCPDRQGRIIIPKYLLELAGVSDEAVIIGSNSHLELWSPERLREEQNRLEKEPGFVISQFAELGI